jgi:hypothetical protein
MPVPPEFTVDLLTGATQKAGAYIIAPKAYVVRNVLVKLDDHGHYADMDRREGESAVTFRSRVAQAQIRRGGSDIIGLTDGIATELGLGHDALVTLTADRDVRVEVTQTQLTVSGTTLNYLFNLVNMDVDGYWTFPYIYQLVDGLNGVDGLTASSSANFSGLPAMLLEPQSSYYQVTQEQAPNIQLFYLGVASRGEQLPGSVVSGTVSFSDPEAFRLQVDTPQAPGEWSLDEASGIVQSYDIPESLTFVNYSINLAISGQPFSLIGNGVKIFDLSSDSVQGLMYTPSGIGFQAKEIMREVRGADRTFWGK